MRVLAGVGDRLLHHTIGSERCARPDRRRLPLDADPDRQGRAAGCRSQLLEKLLRNPGKLITQRQLLHEVWGPQYGTETNYLRVYLAQVRRKLEPEPSHPKYFITEPGMGYRFEP